MFERKKKIKGGKQMCFSIDLDNTFFRFPEVFAAIAVALQNDGHLVGVLTGRFESQSVADRREVESYGFFPNFWYCRPDDDEGKDPRPWKTIQMDQQGIDVHFDDEAKMIQALDGKVVMNVP